MNSTWFLVGPTAVGKTEIAVELAEKLGAEIITADSMQVYRRMDIGTAKPGIELRSRVAHHLIDVVDISERFDVVRYRRLVLAVLPDIDSRGRHPLVVGGSGMYVRALTQGFLEGAESSPEIRGKWMSIGEKRGYTYLHHILKRVDSLSADRISPNDTRRVVRALEHFEITGKPISFAQTQWGNEISRPQVVVGLQRDREELYRRCNQRVCEMIQRGFVEEVESIREELENSRTASQALGYKEILMHLRNEIDRDEMIRLIQERTRRLAKRQLTWFRREPNLTWVSIHDGQPTSDIVALLEPFFCS